MKTLDEVIEKCQENVDLVARGWDEEDCFLSHEYMVDALHYLREYRETKKHLACLDDAEIRGDNTQVVNNPPLTWDELRQMEGKPVWVEEKDMPSTWIIVWDVTENWLYPTSCDVYRHEEYGKTWQAYRRERK